MLKPGVEPVIPNRCAICNSETPDDVVFVRPVWLTVFGFLSTFAGIGKKRGISFHACHACAQSHRRDRRNEAILFLLPMLGVLAVAFVVPFASRFWAFVGISTLSLGALWPSSAYRQRHLEEIVISRRPGRTEFHFTCWEFGYAFGDANVDRTVPGSWEWTSWKAALRHGPRHYCRRLMRRFRKEAQSTARVNQESVEERE